MLPRPPVPIRRDVYVHNEAIRFLITSRQMGGRALDPDTDAWTDAVRAGELIPVELARAAPFVIRVVVGGELTAQEREEWVGRFPWALRVPDGQLAVTGGSEFVLEPAARDATMISEYLRVLEVPAGDYRAVLYAYLSGVNGEQLLELAAPRGKRAEPAGAFFRRTRPGEAFPLWLRRWCVAHPDMDPGHEKEWEGQGVPAEVPELIDFLVHLTPLESEQDVLPRLDQGFFRWEVFEARTPVRCPLGLQASDVLRPGERILEGAAGRVFRRSDMRGLGPPAAARVAETDIALAALGYAPLGDLVCTALGDIVLRGYARPDGDTWAVLIQGEGGTLGPDTFDFVTRFEHGAALTTTRTRGSTDRAGRLDFKTSLPSADIATLHARHEQRKAELAAQYGRPLPVTPELAALARAIDEALGRDAS
jgi:hypothetical protein